MTEYVCPNCRGGFPESDQNHCPFCGQPLNGTYEPPTVHSINKVESDEPESGPLDERLFGWFE